MLLCCQLFCYSCKSPVKLRYAVCDHDLTNRVFEIRFRIAEDTSAAQSIRLAELAEAYAQNEEREAELRQANARLQQRCASLAADLSAAQARQGPLLQRLHRAGRALADLVTPSPGTAAQMPFPTLHSVLSSLRGASSGAPH